MNPSFVSAFVTLAAVWLILRLVPNLGKPVRVGFSLVLMAGFSYLIFAVQPQANNLAVLTGVQWGLFGGALIALGIGQNRAAK